MPIVASAAVDLGFGPASFLMKSVAPKDIPRQEIFVAVLPIIALQAVGPFRVPFIADLALRLPGMLD